nr:MAG TPA: hypothetical protein [Caudoviricetes sp.]DAT56650.1 MAG TPA: hypothetical protein [Caudoviricetes sp.]
MIYSKNNKIRADRNICSLSLIYCIIIVLK